MKLKFNLVNYSVVPVKEKGVSLVGVIAHGPSVVTVGYTIATRNNLRVSIAHYHTSLYLSHWVCDTYIILQLFAVPTMLIRWIMLK